MAEQLQQKQAKVLLANSLTVLWYICWPIAILIYYIAVAVLFVLKLLYRPVGFLLQPVVHLGHFILACLIAPFQLLAKLETLYIYLGIAAITGLVIGLGVSYAYGSLSSLLRLDAEPEQRRLRTAKEYREAKRKEKAAVEPSIMSPGLLPPLPSQASPGYASISDSARKGKRSKGLLGQTIMEEEDSEY